MERCLGSIAEALDAMRRRLCGAAERNVEIELAVISFGSAVETVRGLTSVTRGGITAEALQSGGGGTMMDTAMLRGVEMLRERMRSYHRFGVEYYKPWLVLMTDGTPTEPVEDAAELFSRLTAARRELCFFALGVGSADLHALSRYRECAPNGAAFAAGGSGAFCDFVGWLGESLDAVSRADLNSALTLPALPDSVLPLTQVLRARQEPEQYARRLLQRRLSVPDGADGVAVLAEAEEKPLRSAALAR